jgi:hypothetical protein
LLKKTITYENPFTRKEVTEEHYFHISKSDLIEMEMEEHGQSYVKDGDTLTGMQAKLQRIMDTKDGKAIMSEIKDIIRRSYGRKDGDNFRKTAEIWEEFSSTEAFSQLLFELCTDPGMAAEFINGVVPHNLEAIAEDIRKKAELAQANGDTAQPPMGPRPEAAQRASDPTGFTEKTTPRVLTKAEVVEMDSNELKSGLAEGRYKLS